MNPSYPAGPLPLGDLWPETLLLMGLVAIVAVGAWLKSRGDD